MAESDYSDDFSDEEDSKPIQLKPAGMLCDVRMVV